MHKKVKEIDNRFLKIFHINRKLNANQIMLRQNVLLLGKLNIFANRKFASEIELYRQIVIISFTENSSLHIAKA